MKTTTPTTEKSPDIKAWLMLLLLSLIWGSSYILIKKGLRAYTPEQLACLRISISSIAFSPFFAAKFKQIDWSKLKYLLIVGFLGSGLPAFLFAIAQTELNSSTTGVLSSLTPLFTLLTGIIIFQFPSQPSKIVGVIIGLVGAIILIVFGKESGTANNYWYGLLVMLAALMYSLSANTVQAKLKNMNALTISAAAFFMIGFPAMVYLGFSDFFQTFQTHEFGKSSLVYITILALFGTVLASIVFFQLVQMTNAVFSSMVSYMIPIVAIILGVYDGESISYFHIIGMALILGGVYVSRK